MYWTYRGPLHRLRPRVRETFVIIGAGVAGVRAAGALRNEGFDGRLVLVGAEPHLPYDRPPLSKEVLLGAQPPSDIQLHPEDFYDGLDIELRVATTATRLLPRERRILLATGEALTADKVLLCTGGRPRRLDVPGRDLGCVHCLRTVDDAVAIRDRLHQAAGVVVVGAGWIGAEVAASARELGVQVTLLELAPIPLARVLGDELGRAYAQLHRDRGVDLRTDVGVARIDGRERVREVVTTDGRSVPADLVVVGVGTEPATRLAANAGIAVRNGILVDERGETSVPGVFAAGDGANRLDVRTGRHVRMEHWLSAQRHAVATAGAMLGRREAFSEVPWFWSDQYGIGLQMAGDPARADDVVRRGDIEDLSFAAFYLRQGCLVAAVGINRPRDVRAAMRLIEQGEPVDRAALADASVDLRRLTTRARA
jgi:3-phenylpropionate/trans-cinnamate dioxygenase ferredoxin reductase subunit